MRDLDMVSKNRFTISSDFRGGNSTSLERATTRSDLFMTDFNSWFSFCLVHYLLQRLGCSKAGNITCGDLNLFPRLRIYTVSSFPVDNKECTEISNADFTGLFLQ